MVKSLKFLFLSLSFLFSSLALGGAAVLALTLTAEIKLPGNPSKEKMAYLEKNTDTIYTLYTGLSRPTQKVFATLTLDPKDSEIQEAFFG